MGLVLAGCSHSNITCLHPKTGEGSKPPADVLTDALTAAKSARSVHIFGRVHIQSSNHVFTFDLSTSKDAAVGKLNIGGVAFEFVRIGDVLYMKGNDAFLRLAGAAAAARLHGKWLRASATSHRVAELETLTTLGPYLAILNGYKSGLTDACGSVHGRDRVILLWNSPKHVGINVTQTGEKYPINVFPSNPDAFPSRDVMKFTDWNAPVSPKAPSGAIGIPSLGG
jgi:hypothetical protein